MVLMAFLAWHQLPSCMDFAFLELGLAWMSMLCYTKGLALLLGQHVLPS